MAGNSRADCRHIRSRRGGRLRATTIATAIAVTTTIAFPQTAAAGPSVALVIGYCPTDFTGGGAVVNVDVGSGAWSVVGKFKWPAAVFGCPIESDPTFAVERGTGVVALDFTEDFGLVVEVAYGNATVTRSVTPKDAFFTGFINMVYNPVSVDLVGLSGTVTQSGWCSDGCFQLGGLSLADGTYHAAANVPFKAAMDDTHYVTPDGATLYVQASYDLRPPAQWCVPGKDAATCTLALNTTSGALLAAVGPNAFSVDDVCREDEWRTNTGTGGGGVGAPTPATVLAMVEGGFAAQCSVRGDYAIVMDALPAANASLVACLARNATIDEAAWESTFISLSGGGCTSGVPAPGACAWVTASGDADTGAPQLLVYDAASGDVTLDTALPGLAAALGAASGLFDVWALIGLPDTLSASAA